MTYISIGKKQESKSNLFFIIYLFYIIWIVGIEWINFITKVCGVSYIFGAAEIISVLSIIIVAYILRKRLIIKHCSFCKWQIIGIAVIGLVGIIMSIYPDKAFDTYNYHIIAQNPQFENYFLDDYGYGNFQVWGFRLSDRLFYYFRLILGYRFGTILNTIVLILSYVQLFELLKELSIKINSETNRRDIFFAVWALIILLPLDAIFMLGLYYVDVLSIPIAIEVIRFIFQQNKEEKFSIKEMAYFSLINGIWIALKLTNIIFVLPAVCAFLIHNIKKMKVRHWGIAFVFGSLPFVEYLIYNYICTGNPVFPYFNNIFNSPYFDPSNFIDLRWGGTSFIEKSLWFIYAAFVPQYRQSEIPDLFPATLIIGILSFLYLVLNRIKKQKSTQHNRTINKIILITVFSSLLWGFTTGYSRYFIFGRIMWGILGFVSILELSNKYIKIGNFIKLITSIACGICLILNVSYFLNGRNWSWTQLKTDSLSKEASKVFNDYKSNRGKTDNISVFMLTGLINQSIAEMTNSDAIMINTQYNYGILPDMRKNILDNISSKEGIYDIYSRQYFSISEYIQLLDENKMYVEDFESLEVGPSVSRGEYHLTEIRLNGEKNHLWTFENGSTLIINCNENANSFSTIIGRKYNWEEDEKQHIVLFAKNVDSERIVAEMEIDNIDIKRVKIPISLNEGEKEIIIKVFNSMGEERTDDYLNGTYLINWRIE